MLLDKMVDTIDTLYRKSELNRIEETILESLEAAHTKMMKHYRKINWIYCTVLILDQRHKIETFGKTSWDTDMEEFSVEKFKTIFKNNYFQPQQMSGDYLSIPATSVPSERVFSRSS